WSSPAKAGTPNQQLARTEQDVHFELYNPCRLDSTRPHLMGNGKQIRLPAPLEAERLSGED
ncbi:MAG: hypothetical protein WCK27_30600, partial [Verrucomicrobiota bacterium]